MQQANCTGVVAAGPVRCIVLFKGFEVPLQVAVAWRWGEGRGGAVSLNPTRNKIFVHAGGFHVHLSLRDEGITGTRRTGSQRMTKTIR